MDAKEQANLLLDKIWEGREFPVDPVFIANEMGMTVKIIGVPDEVSGAIIKEKDADPVIVLNEKESKNRIRFTCAHEIGHYILRTSTGNEDYNYIDLRDSMSAQGTDPEEIFANQFAACLLMPEDEVRQLKKLGSPSYYMAFYFGVSGDAINYRLKNLGLL